MVTAALSILLFLVPRLARSIDEVRQKCAPHHVHVSNVCAEVGKHPSRTAL